MACGNRDYNPIEHYNRVLGWVNIFPDKWKTKIESYFKPEIAQEIIALLEAGNFNKSYGVKPLREILCKNDHLTNTKDVGGLKTTYTTSAGIRTEADFSKMQQDFNEKLVSILLVDPKTLKTIHTSEIIADLNIDRANKNLYDFKMELIKKLWAVLQPNKDLDTSYQGSEAFTKLIADTIALYNLKCLTNPDLNTVENWNNYFQLKYFDELIVSFGDGALVKIKPEWNSGRRKSNNMYEYIGPHVAYDTSYNPEEFTTAEQYASKHLQILLDTIFKKINAVGIETKPIGFEMFNRAVTSLIEWVESNPNINYREELYKGMDDPDTNYNGTDWEALITAFINSRKAPKDLYDVLRGIKKLLSRKSTLDFQIKQMLNMQIARVVPYEFEVFRKKWDAKEHQNVIVPMRLRETVVDKQKGSIAKRVRSRIYRSRKRKSSWESFKFDHGIKINSDKTISFSGYTNTGKDIFLGLKPKENNGVKIEGEFIFDWYVKDIDGYRESISDKIINDAKVKELVESLLQIPITKEYAKLLGTDEIVNTNLFDIFKPAIALAVSASEENFAPYSFRLSGIELEIKGSNYADLEFPANFVSIMRGVKDRTTLINGLGNNLPVYQQRSAIFNAKRNLDKGINRDLSEKTDSGISESYGIKRNNIYADNILRNVPSVGSPIGKVIVRTDYNYENSNRSSAEMNFAELNYFSVFKSFYSRLLMDRGKTDGSIFLQTTCLSDKHTHFLVEFLTSKIRLRSGERLDDVLLSLASNVDIRNIKDNNPTPIEREIKWRRAQKTKVEIVNLLNRLEIMLDLAVGDYQYSTVNMSFTELKDRLDKINRDIKMTSIEDLNRLAAKKNVAFFKEADLISLGGETFINETLYKNFLMYCDENNSLWLDRIRREKMAYCKDMFNAGIKLDTMLDKSLMRIVRSLKFDSTWYNEKTGLIQPFIIKDRDGNIVPLTHSKVDIEKYFNSDEYIAILNPVFDSYFYANCLLSNSFNDIIFGEDYGLENKYLREADDILKELKNQKIAAEQELKALEASLSTKFGKDYNDTEKAIIEAAKRVKEIEQAIRDNSYPVLSYVGKNAVLSNGSKFSQYSEASRLTMHYKRTVHGGATYTPLVATHYGVGRKVKVSVIDDIKTPAFSITGNDRKGFTSQDGAGWASPYWSRMCNRSYGDGAVGKNKKTIFSYVDPETGVLTLIKWAEYEITNALRRDSPTDNYHSSYEYAFMKMHNITLTADIFNNFDIKDYYDLDDMHTKKLYVYNPENGRHYLIKNLSNAGNEFAWDLAEVDQNGRELGNVIPNQKRYVKSIYDLDQIFGGAWVEEIKEDGRLDFTEAQNDLIHHIICDLNIKDKFIGWAVNASAVKSGMRNNNSSDIFNAKNSNELRFFEMSTENGGAQMNADHVIGETEVTEMSQVISALVQNGLKVRRVNEVYKFIGEVAAESLGDIVKWQDNPDKLEDVYKWIGEALAYSFSKESDTMGLTTAFITKANQNLEQYGLLTRIPLSAPSIKGKFEATITSFINSNAIKRRYPGGGYVQNPAFDARLRYNFNGNSYSYSEFLGALREYNSLQLDKFKISAQSALTDYSWNSDKKKFNNPFIEILSPVDNSLLLQNIVNGKRSTSTLDIGDTIIVFDLDSKGNMINIEEPIQLDDFYKWDKYRNLIKDRYIAHWTVRPKNLLGSRTFFDVNGVQHSLYDLDSVRALMYSQLKFKDLSSDYKDFLQRFVQKYASELNFDTIDWTNQEQINQINRFARWQVKRDLKNLSKIQASKFGAFDWQEAFGPILGESVVSNFTFKGSQILMGLGARREFGIRNRSDLAAVQKNSKSFFVKQLQYLKAKPLRKTVDPNNYDAVLHGTDGTTALLVVENLRTSLPDGLVSDIEYKKDDSNHIWYRGEDLGYAKGIDFYTYIGKDGETFTVIKADNLASFTAFNNASKLYTTILPNANKSNWERIAENTPDVLKDKNGDFYAIVDGERRDIPNSDWLNFVIEAKVTKNISKLAEKKARSWNAYKKGIGARIPAQSMQSFVEGEIIGFTDDEDTSVYVSTTLAWLMGSDFDIDKLYWMTYGLTEDGMLATFTDLDNILDPEECLVLPKPKGRKIKVAYYSSSEELDGLQLMAYTDGRSYKTIDAQGDGIKLLKECLADDVEDGMTVFVNIQDVTAQSWDPYVQDHAKEKHYKNTFQHWLNTHERSRRNNIIKKIALRNVVVRGILDVLHDVSTQYNLQIPISMDEQKAAAELSTMAAEERYLTSDQPGSTFKMTVQNMIGREVISVGASSLKAFFGATTYFNTTVEAIQQLHDIDLDEDDNEIHYWKDEQTVWNLLRSLVFNAKFGDKSDGLITFANINFEDLLDLIKNNPNLQYIKVKDLNCVDANNNLEKINEETGQPIHSFITKDVFGNYIINILEFVNTLNNVSNGEWNSQIDAAYSLSGLISAATDNAKELILAKINATTKFADIYTYLLSIGTKFEDIASFMISDEFNIIAKYSESDIIDPNTSWNNLESAIKFVLNESTLPVVDNKIFNWILTSINQNGMGVIDRILSDVVTKNDTSALENLNKHLGRDIWNGSNLESVKGILIRVINSKTKENDPTEYTDDYKNVVQWVYQVINSHPEYLIQFLQYKVGQADINESKNQNNEPMPEPEPTPEDVENMEDAHEEAQMAKSYNFNGQLSRDEWRRYLQYTVHYLIPKNDAMRNVADVSKLLQLRKNILPALKELRMLSHLLGVNRGIETDDFDEYKWIRDVETFVNQRYYDGKQDYKPFDFMLFIKDETYRKQQIEQYESVKSTYNILDIVNKSGHFWEMLKAVRTNRIYIEKAVVNKYTRNLANKILEVDKKVQHGISGGATQKLNDREYRILQSTVRDIVTLNWISTLSNTKISIPLRRSPNMYFNKDGSPAWVRNPRIKSWTKDGRPLDENGNLLSDAETSIDRDLNDTIGFATFKWLMENYIIDELKKHTDFKDNEFIQDLQNDYKKDSNSEEVIEFITLPISLTNPDHNSELEEYIDTYKVAFNKIAKQKVPVELGIGDWTIGDLFFLYNLYVHKEGLGGNSLTRLFDNMIISDDPSLLINNYYNYLCKLDSGVMSIEEIDKCSELTFKDVVSLSGNALLKDVRQQFVDTPSAASKFRVRRKANGDQEFLDKSYQKQGINWPRSRVDKNYFLFNLALYNPVKLQSNPSLERVREMKNQAKSRNVNTKDAVEVVVSYLQRTFAGIIPITTVNDEWIAKNMQKLNNHARNALGFILNGKIYINVDHATVSTPIHELMHIVFATLKFGNDLQRDAYYNLLNIVKEKKATNDPVWRKYWDDTASLYEDYAIGSDLKEEVLIRYMEDIFTTAYLEGLQSSNGPKLSETSEIKAPYLEFEERILRAVEKAFAVHLPNNSSLKDVLGLSIGELLVNFHSDLMNFDPEDISMTYLPNTQKIARFKRKMVETENLKINGDC